MEGKPRAAGATGVASRVGSIQTTTGMISGAFSLGRSSVKRTTAFADDSDTSFESVKWRERFEGQITLDG
jgi:hypothetical protein